MCFLCARASEGRAGTVGTVSESPDTTIDDVIGDMKAASACMDDARTKLSNLLDYKNTLLTLEEKPWSVRDVLALESACQCINQLLLPKSDAIVGSITRVLERLK